MSFVLYLQDVLYPSADYLWLSGRSGSSRTSDCKDLFNAINHVKIQEKLSSYIKRFAAFDHFNSSKTVPNSRFT